MNEVQQMENERSVAQGCGASGLRQAVGQPYWLGVDMGASSVKLAALNNVREVVFSRREAHEGAPAAVLGRLLGELDAALGLAGCAGWAMCGSASENAGDRLGAAAPQALGDVPATAAGAALLAPQARSVIEIGAQGARYLTDLGARMPSFAMNESCAAGTGSFFEDQMMRLGLPLEDYSRIVGGAQSVPRLSGRCAVFAKTDIIHRQQEGVPVEDILQGLCHAMVKTYKATIVRSLPVQAPVALAGGVLMNEGVVRAVCEVFGLGEDELLVQSDFVYLPAVGCALEALEAGEGHPETVSDNVTLMRLAAELRAEAAGDAAGLTAAASRLARLEPLPPQELDRGLGFEALPRSEWKCDSVGLVPCTLGVDVGSTSTNLVLVDLEGHLLDAQYLRTRGNPKAAVGEGLASLEARLGGLVRVVAAAATGSGRTMIGEHVGADVVRDEITCQARGASSVVPDVDTVFEIGGQDSKYVSLRDGRVNDFQMNKVCAAGTGSFIEEQAARLGIPLPEYGALAFSATAPVDLGERCTVFVETAINAALSAGATKAEVAAGLCQSVVRNYLHKVVGSKHVGSRIVLQGGVCYNPALVAAFKQFYGERVSVNPNFAVSGAFGAALMALDAWHTGCGLAADGAGVTAEELIAASEGHGPRVFETSFKGFDLLGGHEARAQVNPEEVERNLAYFARTKEAYEQGYTGELDPEKKTVGIPRALMLHKLFPMANAFFKALGFNVLLSRESDEETVRDCQGAAQGETCFPFKLLHGHMKQLADAGVDYIFMPRIHTVRHVKSTVDHNYACPYMQVGAELAAQELDFAGRGIELISPQFEMDYGQNAIADSLLEIGEHLGFTRQQAARAMLKGGFAVMKFTKVLEDYGDELLRSLKPGERAIVLVTRNYNFEDPILNSGIARALIERGYKVLTVSHLHAHSLDISMDYPGLYWPFAQHVISGAKLVRRDPRLFAVYLTNHGCGPDAMVSHLFRKEMGDKPYLQVEMDEHYSPVGIVTRIEAFLNAIEGYTAPEERLIPTSVEFVDTEHVTAVPGVPCAMPAVGPYGEFVAEWLRGRGISDARLLETTDETLELGRRETTSKEYLTFADTLGLALAAGEGRIEREACGCAGAAGQGSKAFLTELDEGSAGVGGAGVGAVSGEGTGQESAFLTELAAPVATPSTPGEFLHGNDPAASRLQLLLPSAEGGEIDGQYGRVIRSILDERGMRDVAVVAPALDKLPCAVDDIDGLFMRLLAGDVVFAAPREQRAAVAAGLAEALEKVERADASADGDDDAGTNTRRAADALACVLDAAHRVAVMPAAPGKRLGLVGEWPVVCGDALDGGMWAELEKAGNRLVRMPLAEYLLFLWHDAAQADEHERVTNDIMPILGETGVEMTPGMPDFTKRDFGLYTAGVQVTHDGHPLDDSQIDFSGTAGVDTASGASVKSVDTAQTGEGTAPLIQLDLAAGFTTEAAAPEGITPEQATAVMQALEGHCGAHGSDDACATCGAGCASDTTQPQVDAVTSASLSHIIGPDGMPQSAHEPMRPNLLAYRRKLSTPEWAEVLNRLEAMRIQVATALGDASPYERDLEALRSRATSLIGQFRGANARYRYAKAVALHERCDGVIEAASMYENVDLVLRLREQALGLEPPILHLSFDGTLDGSPAEKLRTYLYYL